MEMDKKGGMMNRDQALTATLDELRDALAEMDGWKWRPYGGRKDLRLWYKNDGDESVRDPHPPTLDGADAAMPEGWWWSRLSWASKVWTAGRGDEPASVEVPDTGDKIADLYALALACRKAMENKA